MNKNNDLGIIAKIDEERISNGWRNLYSFINDELIDKVIIDKTNSKLLLFKSEKVLYTIEVSQKFREFFYMDNFFRDDFEWYIKLNGFNNLHWICIHPFDYKRLHLREAPSFLNVFSSSTKSKLISKVNFEEII